MMASYHMVRSCSSSNVPVPILYIYVCSIIFSGSSKQSQFSTVWWVQCGVRSLSAGQGADECIHSTLNLSIEDTIGTHLALLYKKVFLIQS